MEPRDRIERREHGAFLPGEEHRGVLAREDDPSVDLAQVAIVLAARLVAPAAEAAVAPRHAMPADRDAVLELRGVLRMDLRALLDRAPHAFLRWHRGELVGIPAEDVGAQEHALAGLAVV